MHTIIKIAVVSVLSLFAIVGLVSISKADNSVNFVDAEIINKIFTNGKVLKSHSYEQRQFFTIIYEEKLFYCKLDGSRNVISCATPQQIFGTIVQ